MFDPKNDALTEMYMLEVKGKKTYYVTATALDKAWKALTKHEQKHAKFFEIKLKSY